MKKTFFFLVLAILAISCTKHEFEQVKDPEASEVSILAFSSLKEFETAYNTNQFNSPNKSFNDTIYSGGHFTISSLRANNTNTTKNISLEVLVPDDKLANMLNSKGEIIINDTLYRITKDGTFYTFKNNREILNKYVEKIDSIQEEHLGNDLYRYENVFRYDTYKNVNFEEEEEDDEVLTDVVDNESKLRTSNPNMFIDIDVSGFKKTNPHPENFISKIWAKHGGRISNITRVSKDRRLNAEVYSYNNIFMYSSGVSAKVQKKMWYGGWAKLKYWGQDALRVGFRNTLVITSLKNSINNIPETIYVRDTEKDDDIYKRCMRIVYDEKDINGLYPRANVVSGISDIGNNITAFTAYPILHLAGNQKVCVFHPGFWGKNANNKTEIDFYFSRGFNTISIGIKNISPFTFMPNDHGNVESFIKNNLLFNSKNENKTRIFKGTMYAAMKYNNKWHGLIMEW